MSTNSIIVRKRSKVAQHQSAEGYTLAVIGGYIDTYPRGAANDSGILPDNSVLGAIEIDAVFRRPGSAVREIVEISFTQQDANAFLHASHDLNGFQQRRRFRGNGSFRISLNAAKGIEFFVVKENEKTVQEGLVINLPEYGVATLTFVQEGTVDSFANNCSTAAYQR